VNQVSKKKSEIDLAFERFYAACDAVIANCKEVMAACGAVTGKEEEPAEKPLTLVQVRGVLAEKSRAGFTDEIRALLEKHGGSKLSDISPDRYPELLKDAEGLGNG